MRNRTFSNEDIPRPVQTYRAARREAEKASKRGVARTDKIEKRKLRKSLK